MSDLRRWLDEAPPSEVRRLLEVGQWARPSHSVLEQTLARVHAGAAEAALDAGFPTKPSSALRPLVKWSVAGALLLGSIGALMYGMRSGEPVSRQVDAQQPTELAPVVPRAPRAVAQAAPASAPAANAAEAKVPSQDGASLEPRKSRAVSAPASVPASASETAAHAKVCKPGVVEQIQMLEQAKSSIQRNRGAQALAILDRYDSFGAGRCFVPESMKHRMDAYALTGNSKGAERTASSIKTQYPETAQARAADAVLKQK